jgi:nucleoid-associated protein Lsr2
MDYCRHNDADQRDSSMAKETITRLVDDLDGGVAHETVTFGLDGHLYEIDLSTRNAKKLRTELATFVEHGNRVSARAAIPARSGRRASSGLVHPDQNRAIREWAQAKGYQIAQRGRIKQDIVDAFHESAGR